MSKPTAPAPRRVRGARLVAGRRSRRAAPILRVADVRAMLREAAGRIAPADVTALVGRADELRARADGLPPHLSWMRQQLDLALDCLRDHATGACPQIPYFTIALLAAAVYYFADEIDVIPDFLPHVGQLDDAAVLALACRMAAAGLQRYCTWRSVPLPSPPPVRTSRARAPAP